MVGPQHTPAYGQHYAPPASTQPPSQPQMQALSQPSTEPPSPGTRNYSSTDVGSNPAAPKPKKAKTQKKSASAGGAGKDAPQRGKGAKSGGKGRGKGGFMIDNLLHARKEGEEEEEGENTGDINDIASYVATDEYFKEQTKSK